MPSKQKRNGKIPPEEDMGTGKKLSAQDGDEKLSLKQLLLSEDKFAEEMEELAEPCLAAVRREGRLDVRKRKTFGTLHYELYPLENPVATVVISHGFTESALKYHELIYYFLKQGFQAAIVEHRGHGFSLREGKSADVVHVDSFSEYVDDFHDFVQKIVIPRLGKKAPLFLYAHSMGGCIGVQCMEKYPGEFDRAALSSPMLELNTGKIPAWAACLLCRLMIGLGKGEERIFLQGEFDPEESFEESAANSRARHEYYQGLRRQLPECQTSSGSYRWTLEAIRAGKKAIAVREAQKITVPVLLFQAGEDTLVCDRGQNTFLKRIPNGRLRRIPGVRHEIYRAPDEVLEGYLEEVLRFFGDGGSRED